MNTTSSKPTIATLLLAAAAMAASAVGCAAPADDNVAAGEQHVEAEGGPQSSVTPIAGSA